MTLTYYVLLLAVVGLLDLGCKPLAKIPSEISQLHPQIATMIAMRSQSQASVMSQYITGKKYVQFFESGKFKGLRKESYKMPPMFYSFADSSVWYISCSFDEADKDTAAFSMSKMVAILREPQRMLPSVLDYPWREYIYPDIGLAFNVNVEKGYYDVIEVFQPTNWKKYKLYFWNDPSQYPSRH